jgi:hypothetical protein
MCGQLEGVIISRAKNPNNVESVIEVSKVELNSLHTPRIHNLALARLASVGLG